MHIFRTIRQGWALSPWVSLFMAGAVFAASSVKPPAGPEINRPAPIYSAPDVDGKMRSLADYKGRTVVTFFMCGCEWCAPVADLWSQMQRGGTLIPTAKSAKPPITIIVFSGDANLARTFSSAHGFDLNQTVLIPDEEMKITDELYHVDPCPRAFVVDPQGILRYTNNHPDDAARKAPAIAIVSRTVDAVRATVAKPPVKVKRKPAAAGKRMRKPAVGVRTGKTKKN